LRSIASHCGREARHCDFLDPLSVEVRNEHVAVHIAKDAISHCEGRGSGWSRNTCRRGHAAAREYYNYTRKQINATNIKAFSVREIKVSHRVSEDLMRFTELGTRGGSAVTRYATHTDAPNRGDDQTGKRELSN
jgi:hypothetical protein